MFVVGLEVDLAHILKQRAAVVLISNFSIVLPLALGVGLATASIRKLNQAVRLYGVNHGSI